MITYNPDRKVRCARKKCENNAEFFTEALAIPSEDQVIFLCPEHAQELMKSLEDALFQKRIAKFKGN